MRELAPHLPASQQSTDDLKSQLRGPQFRQALGHLQQVCSGPEYHSLLASLGMPLDSDMGVEGFLKAIQTQADKAKAEKEEAEEGDKMKDDGEE